MYKEWRKESNNKTLENIYLQRVCDTGIQTIIEKRKDLFGKQTITL